MKHRIVNYFFEKFCFTLNFNCEKQLFTPKESGVNGKYLSTENLLERFWTVFSISNQEIDFIVQSSIAIVKFWYCLYLANEN